MPLFSPLRSKSLGNGVDPRDIISTHGADALRYLMAQLTTGTQDVRLGVDLICPYTGESFEPEYVTSLSGHKVMAPIQTCPTDSSKHMSTVYGILTGESTDCEETPLAMNTSFRFDVGRNFANKFWNASRFALMNISEPAEHVSSNDLLAVDQWMLHRVEIAVEKMNESLGNYKFNVATETIYDLLWRDFCDWYLEAIKPTVKDSPSQQRVLHTVLDVICRLLHPICPFVTEAMWPHVHSISAGSVEGVQLNPSNLAAIAPWPQCHSLNLHADEVSSFEKIRELVTAIRGARASQNVSPKREIDLLAPTSLFKLATTHSVVASP